MRLIVAVAALAVFSGPVSAACVGTAQFKSCTDISGNSYSVSNFGNSTVVNGRNSQTGSSWSQQSNRVGNNTYTYGRAANGQSWNSTSTPYGTYGTDSDGDSFYDPN